jgi:hypothetical protein
MVSSLDRFRLRATRYGGQVRVSSDPQNPRNPQNPRLVIPSMRYRLQVLAQQIAAEVAFEIAPHRVHVVALVL